jgi:hypothetical protein
MNKCKGWIINHTCPYLGLYKALRKRVDIGVKTCNGKVSTMPVNHNGKWGVWLYGESRSSQWISSITHTRYEIAGITLLCNDQREHPK